MRIFVPGDTAARSVGADEVAALLAELPDAEVVRNGSRGLLWLEPLVEVETPLGRIAYGPVSPADVESLVAADLAQGGAHPLRLGGIEHHPWFGAQDRVTFARVGVVDPLSVDDYERLGGLSGLRNALADRKSVV